MTIVCGTDFSKASRDAIAVAAKLSCRTKQQLVLVHAITPQFGEPVPVDLEPARAAAMAVLDEEAAELRTKGLEVVTSSVVGWADEVLLGAAKECDADLIVLGAVGHRRGAHWLIGSIAEYVAQATPIPLLLVRDRSALEESIEGSAVLRVVLATDFSPVSDHALEWLQKFSTSVRCETVLAYVANPVIEAARLNLSGPVRRRLDPSVEQVIRRELREREKQMSSSGPTRSTIKLSLDAPAKQIVETAAEEEASLVVVGAHQRRWLARAWTGSISQAVVHASPTNVVCVPFHTADERFRALETPEIKTVLAATDFSPCGNRAVAWATGVAPKGAKIVIFNAAADADAHDHARNELAEMDQPRSWPDNIEIEVDVARSDDVAKSICAAAQRHGADMIVAGAHGHRGLRVSLGSVARELLALSTIPVLVVRDEAQ